MNSIQLSNYLLEELNLAVIPGIVYGVDGFIRFSYAQNRSEIIEGVNRLISI